MRRTVSLLLILFVVVPVFAAEKVTLYGEKETRWGAARGLSSAIDIQPLPAQGPLQHGLLVSAHSLSDFHDAISLIKGAYDAGLPIVIVAPAPQSQSFPDDITGGTVDLPKGVTSKQVAVGEPMLQAIAIRRPAGDIEADIAEFWDTFDDDDGPAAEEKAEDDRLVASIADWVREKPSAVATPTPAPRMPRTATRLAKEEGKRPAIDDLTSAVVRKVSFAVDQASMATVVRSCAAYSPGQNEDWYIFELTTTSQPLNFETQSLAGMFSNWEKGDANCRGISKTGCKRLRYATKVQVKLVPKTAGLELVYYGPDSDRAQDEYSYSSKFSLGGKVTAGFDEKGPKGGVELSGGAEFSRSTKVTIKDATLVGISNPATDLAGWRFDMPRMRAVNDLTQYGGPSMNCDNLLQMPYPVQQGAMESRQYAIYRLPAGQRARINGIDVAVSLALEEGASRVQNSVADYYDFFSCNCSPESWVHKNHELNDNVISFPLAAHPVGN